MHASTMLALMIQGEKANTRAHHPSIHYFTSHDRDHLRDQKPDSRMPTESVGRNYERNRENRSRRRRLKGSNVESVHEGLTKTPAGLRRSRIDMPTRSAKSLNNLTLIERESDGNQGNNACTGGGGGLMPITRFIKWYRNLSTTRESVPPATSRRVITVDQNPLSPPHQQSSHVGRKQGYAGPLGLGEYVDSMGGGFDETDPTNGSPQTQIKSRSLIDISMSKLWGEDEEIGPYGDGDEAGRNGSWEKLRRPSILLERRPSLLATISRLLHIPLIPPNLLQFMDSPLTSVNIYENTEITFFGSSEDRWSTPALVVTTCSRMQRGDLFSVQYLSDYLAELKLVTYWAKRVKSACKAELRKYKVAGKGKRPLRLTAQGNSWSCENEAELRDLCADITAFLEAYDTFVAKTKDEFRGNSVSAILIAGHNERFASLKSLLPIAMPCAPSEAQKTSGYRKLLCETPATATFSSLCQVQEGPIEVSAFLYTDCLLIASKCRFPKISTASSTSSAKYTPRSSGSTTINSPPSSNRTPGVFETLTRLPLTFLSVTTPIPTVSTTFPSTCESMGGSLTIKVTPPVLCSSSSGISSAASTEEEMEAGSENGSAASGCEEAVQALSLWWPPGNRCHLVFGEIRSFIEWRNCLQTSMEQIQSCFTNQILQVKVLNGIAPEKCVHKYLPLSPSITVRELKERALTAWNIGSQVDSEVVISFVDPIRGSLELPLADEDKPFLLTLYVITLTGEKVTDEAIDLFATDHTDRGFTPRSLAFPLTPDRIPLTFTVRDSNNSTSSNSSLRPLPISMDHDLFEPLVHLMNRPKSILYHETSRAHRTLHLRGLSLSTQNLSASSTLAGASSGSGGSGGGGKGRSRSRLRLRLSRNNMFSLGNDNGDDKNPSPQQFGIFGRLPKEAWPDCRVSMSVMSLFVVIFYKGSLTEGIFRRSVQLSHLQALVQRVDTNEDPLMAEECPPLHAASILKKYFKEIPGHLLIDEKWDDWCKMVTLKTDEEIANYAKKMMRELPDINQSLLTFLLFTLAQVRVNQDTNKMSVESLSTVWAPNLLERPKAAPSVEDTEMSVAVVQCLLGPFTDVYCLHSPEFRQKLSVFFDEIWGQMMPPGGAASKPPPEGISILELPEQKPDDIAALNGGLGSPRSLEPLHAKDQRNSWMTRSSSAELSNEMAYCLRRCSREFKRESKSFISRDGADLPPPIPPRHRNKSTSGCAYTPISSPAATCTTSAMEMDSPPPVPARTFGPFQGACNTPNEQRRKMGVVSRDAISVSGTTVVDRRRSFSRRRNPSRSPVHSCTIGLDEPSLRTLMIGDICEDYDGLDLRQGDVDINQSKSKLAEIEPLTNIALKRSTSDVDAYPMNKQMTIRRKSQHIDSPQFLECETIPGGTCFFWNTVAARRMSSRNHRCETRWTCGLYAEAGGKNDPSRPNASNNVTLLSRRHTELASIDSSRPTGVRPRPTATFLEDRSYMMFPNMQKTSTAPEVPISICRRINSTYEQKRGMNETGLKNFTFRGSLVSPDQLNSTNSGSTHLSRGSSHASTGSSTSTILGPN